LTCYEDDEVVSHSYKYYDLTLDGASRGGHNNNAS